MLQATDYVIDDANATERSSGGMKDWFPATTRPIPLALMTAR